MMPEPFEVVGLPVAESGPSTWGHHRDEAFAICPRLYAYEFEERLEPTGIHWPYITGRGYHAGLAEWYGRMQIKQQTEQPYMMTLEDQEAAIAVAEAVMRRGIEERLEASPSLTIDFETQCAMMDE